MAEALALELHVKGAIKRQELRAVFAKTPRHSFVPTFQRIDGIDWIDETNDDWLSLIYSDVPLVTQTIAVRGQPDVSTPSSSSTTPSLMADMIETLEIRAGDRVLESGTGTGYNAAILCGLVGDDHVTTIDIDPTLAGQARIRLATTGNYPQVDPSDHSYDVILATHSVEDVPAEWLRYARPGARILVDMRSEKSPDVGAWALLTVDEDARSATGNLMPARGTFMGSRKTPDEAPGGWYTASSDVDLMRRRSSLSTLLGRALSNAEFAFFVWRKMRDVSWSVAGDAVHLVRADGQWTNVSDSGEVIYSEPDDLWDAIEYLHAEWDRRRRPTFQDMCIHVAEDSGTSLRVV